MAHRTRAFLRGCQAYHQHTTTTNTRSLEGVASSGHQSNLHKFSAFDFAHVNSSLPGSFQLGNEIFDLINDTSDCYNQNLFGDDNLLDFLDDSETEPIALENDPFGSSNHADVLDGFDDFLLELDLDDINSSACNLPEPNSAADLATHSTISPRPSMSRGTAVEYAVESDSPDQSQQVVSQPRIMQKVSASAKPPVIKKQEVQESRRTNKIYTQEVSASAKPPVRKKRPFKALREKRRRAEIRNKYTQLRDLCQSSAEATGLLTAISGSEGGKKKRSKKSKNPEKVDILIAGFETLQALGQELVELKSHNERLRRKYKLQLN